MDVRVDARRPHIVVSIALFFVCVHMTGGGGLVSVLRVRLRQQQHKEAMKRMGGML